MLEFDPWGGILVPSCRCRKGEFSNSYFKEVAFFFLFKVLLMERPT
jgi:hypothetical protein